jgi:hypothetical protein
MLNNKDSALGLGLFLWSIAFIMLIAIIALAVMRP